MKSIFQSGVIAMCILFLAPMLNAQNEQWTWTQQLLGNWKGPVTLGLGDQSFDITYRMQYKSAVDGNAMTMDEGFSHPDIGTLKGANLIGLNATDGLIHWFSADNFGTAHEHLGSWSDSKHFHMEHTSTIEGLPFVEIIDLVLNSNNTKMEANLVATLDDAVIQTLEGTLTKNNGTNESGYSSPAQTFFESNPFVVDVYPNPTSGEITMESEGPIDELVIFNEKAQIVFESQPKTTSYRYQFKEAGPYIIQVKKGEEMISRKINVLQH